MDVRLLRRNLVARESHPPELDGPRTNESAHPYNRSHGPMINPKLVALAVVSTSLAAATPAFADEPFGATGQVILSGERLFGLSFPRIMTEDGATGTKQTESHTN